jgi:hypothetical protein
MKYAKKGTMIAVSGELQIEKKNEKIYTRVNVDDFKFWNNKQSDKVESKEQSDEFEIPEDFFKEKTDLPF